MTPTGARAPEPVPAARARPPTPAAACVEQCNEMLTPAHVGALSSRCEGAGGLGGGLDSVIRGRLETSVSGVPSTSGCRCGLCEGEVGGAFDAVRSPGFTRESFSSTLFEPHDVAHGLAVQRVRGRRPSPTPHDESRACRRHSVWGRGPPRLAGLLIPPARHEAPGSFPDRAWSWRRMFSGGAPWQMVACFSKNPRMGLPDGFPLSIGLTPLVIRLFTSVCWCASCLSCICLYCSVL